VKATPNINHGNDPDRLWKIQSVFKTPEYLTGELLIMQQESDISGLQICLPLLRLGASDAVNKGP
jgi:hypothetical protein